MFVSAWLCASAPRAEETSRTPQTPQAALRETRKGRRVTTGGNRHKLPEPFFVLATQNPIEQEGTYPLPEAQQDRFMFHVRVEYPNEAEEYEIVERTTSAAAASVTPVLTAAEIQTIQTIVRSVPVAPHVIRYAMKFTRLTRKDDDDAPELIR